MNPFASFAALCLTLGLVLCGCSSDPDTKTDTATDAGADAQVGADSLPAVDGGDGAGGEGVVVGDAGPQEVTSSGFLTPRLLRFDEDLHAAWGTDPSDVWVVGKKGRILHWNGKTLAPRASGTSADLFAVGGFHAQDVYFAGNGVILQWNGTQISDVTPPEHKTAVFRAMHAAPGGPSLYVAGDNGVIVRRNQGVWTTEVTPTPLNLRGIWAAGSGVVWAVGEQGQALKLSGGSWSATAIPKAGKTLRVVTASPDGRFFAAGDGGFLGVTSTGVWEATAGNDLKNRNLAGLWARSDSEAWAIGDEGALLQFSPGNKKWDLAEIAGTYMKTQSFSAMWGAQGKNAAAFAVAVGQLGAGVRFDGEKWLDWRAETSADLRAVASADDGALYACGDGGLLLRAADGQAAFVDLAAPVSAATLHDVVAGGEPGSVWAVGQLGASGQAGAQAGLVVQRKTDGSFQVGPAAASELRGVARLGSGILAVGSGGVAVSGTFGAWKTEATGSQLGLESVAVAGSIAYAVGDFGTILRRAADGVWSGEDSGELANLKRVVAWSETEAAAVGDGGVVLVRGASGWKKAFESPGVFLYGLARRADGTLLAVGYGGALVVGKPGGTFQKLPGGVPNILHDIATTASGTVAVGKKGGVFQVAEKLP